MDPEPNAAWLFLAVGEYQEHGGNDGYLDEPGLSYRWDSTVPNHARPRRGDAIVVWDKRTLLGISVIERISVGHETKFVNRCPSCGLSSLKARRARRPTYRCDKCKAEFDEVLRESVEVSTYRSEHGPGWTDASGLMPAAELRNLAVDVKSQLSLRPLQWEAFVSRFAELCPTIPLSTVDSSFSRLSGGHRTVTVRARVGQSDFRSRLLRRYGENCALTGPCPGAALEAAHLYSYATEGVHHEDGGLLLRRDFHKLFDQGLIAVNPMSGQIDVSPAIGGFEAYGAFHHTKPAGALSDRQWRWLRWHWLQHRGPSFDSRSARA